MTLIGLFGTVLGLSLWLGGIVFLVFYVRPELIRRLATGKAAEVIGVITRSYYFLSYACGCLMLFGASWALSNAQQRANTIAFMCFTACALGLSLYGGIVVQPRARDLRERLESSAGSEENLWLRDRFDHTHRLALFLGGCVIVLLVCATFALSSLFA